MKSLLEYIKDCTYSGRVKLASGEEANTYYDIRKLISKPEAMQLVTNSFVEFAKNLNFLGIAGGESAGIPFAAFLAKELHKPMCYVRKKNKEYGMDNLIEGGLLPPGNVILVEDLITDGGSKIAFIENLREYGFTVTDCFVVFDRKNGGKENLERIGVKLHSII